MRTYRTPRDLLADIERTLAVKPSPQSSPLEEVTSLLSDGRHYSWVAIYLAFGVNSARTLVGSGRDSHPGQMASPETKSKILVSMKLAGREIGVLDVESDHDNAFGAEDRVLLENVANRLARFLTGPGKYLVRKARTQGS